MPEPVITCRHCPAELHLAADTQQDEWVWHDVHGRMTGSDPGLPADPYGYIADLGEAIMAAHKAHRPGKAEFTGVFWAAGREYSMLKVRLETGGTWHTHSPREHGPALHQGPVPEHCGWPMWLRPSGWQCRQCRARAPLAHVV